MVIVAVCLVLLLVVVAAFLYLGWTITRLKKALMYAVAGVDREKRIQLQVVNRIVTQLTLATNTRKRNELINNVTRYRDQLKKETNFGEVVSQT